MRAASALALAAVAASLGLTSASRAAEKAAGGAGTSSKVATVGQRTITRAELEEHVRPKLIEIESEKYEALREGLDELVAEELEKQEAKARGVTVDDLQRRKSPPRW